MTERHDKDIVGHDWVIHNKIGRGTFSEIWSARSVDGGKPAAVKIDIQKGASLDWESSVLEQMQDTTVVPRHYKYIEDEEEGHNILVMEVLGPSISQLRHRHKSAKVPVSIATYLGVEMIKCLEAFHKKGYVHRDIKPSNFGEYIQFIVCSVFL